MKRHSTLLTLLCFFVMSISTMAQNLTEITGKRLYEHHSPTVQKPNGAPGGDQSGYDFVNHDYVSSFDPNTFNAYTNGMEQNIDMVEHTSGQGMLFGITSGVSSIWAGDIRGNGTTKWMMASTGFDYDNVNTVADLETEYNAGTPDSSIEVITEGGVYIARIRNTQMYVAMKCYNVTNGNPGTDTYFDFDYKYGTVSGNIGFQEVTQENSISLFPNPAHNTLTVENNRAERITLSINSIEGRLIKTFEVSGNGQEIIDISDCAQGSYVVKFQLNNGAYFMQSLVKY